MGSVGSTVEHVAHLILGRVVSMSSWLQFSSSWSNTKRGLGRTAAPIYTFLHALSAISRRVGSWNALLSSSIVFSKRGMMVKGLEIEGDSQLITFMYLFSIYRVTVT